MKRLLAALAIAAAAFVPSATYVASGSRRMTVANAQLQDKAAHPRNCAPVMFLQVNDVYSTVPIDGLGGLARVATLKQRCSRAPDGCRSSSSQAIFCRRQWPQAWSRVLIAPESGDLLVTAFEKFVKQKQEITQPTDGRITIP